MRLIEIANPPPASQGRRDVHIRFGHSVHGEEEVAAVCRVLRTGPHMGRHVAEMETRVAQLFDKTRGIMVNSGSSANYLAIEILELQPGDEVLTPALTFGTTVAPIIRNRLIPVFVDAAPGTYNVDAEKVEEMIGPRTRAMIIPSLLGNQPDWAHLRDLADRHGLTIIEDSADTLGARLHGLSSGSYTDISTTSFYGGNLITCAGNGGMLCVRDEIMARKAILLRSWGQTSSLFDEADTLDRRFGLELDGIDYDAEFLVEELGYNLEPSEIGAAFGLIQLDRLEQHVSKRARNVAAHLAFFRDYEHWLELPRPMDGATFSWLAFPLSVRADAPFARRDLQIALELAGIETRPVFSGNILRQPVMRRVSSRVHGAGYPVADDVMRGGVLLPCQHGLDLEDIAQVHDAFRAFASQF